MGFEGREMCIDEQLQNNWDKIFVSILLSTKEAQLILKLEALNHDMEKANDCHINGKKTRVTEISLFFSVRITTIFDF